jgi:histidine triad (HIT) family protein
LSADECIFCRIVDGTEPASIVYRDDDVVAFEDIRPVAPVHILLIPTKHIPNMRYIDASNETVLTTLFHAANRLAKEKGIDEAGYRININTGPNGGQTVYHLHLHLLGGRFMTWPPG